MSDFDWTVDGCQITSKNAELVLLVAGIGIAHLF